MPKQGCRWDFLGVKDAPAAPPTLPATSIPAKPQKTEPKKLFEGRNKQNNADITQYDLHGKGNPDIIFIYPDDIKERAGTKEYPWLP